MFYIKLIFIRRCFVINNLIKKLYVPELLDWLFLLLGIILISTSNKNVIFQTGFWSIFIFLGSIAITSYSKNINEKFNRVAKKKKKHIKRHKDISYSKFEITKIQYDLNINFKTFRLSISTIGMVILAIVNTFYKHSYQFEHFILSFLINLFLIPLFSMLYFAFSFDCTYSEKAKVNRIIKVFETIKYAFRNMLNALYGDENGKKRIVKGTIGLLMIIFFIILIASFKLYEIII